MARCKAAIVPRLRADAIEGAVHAPTGQLLAGQVPGRGS
jgi:hypothetical protein